MKVIHIPMRNTLFIFICLLCMCITGCATLLKGNAVGPDDEATVHYTCRLENGELAATTLASVANDPGVAKSAIFTPRKTFGPVKITPAPGTERKKERADQALNFTEEIEAQLRYVIQGLHAGGSQTVQLAPRSYPDDPQKHQVQLARVRKRPREMRMTPDNYRSLRKKDPVVGDEMSLDKDFPGKVTAVTEDEVVVSFKPRHPEVIDTSFGPGRIVEKGDHYEMHIDATLGRIVRIGPLVGRIAVIEKKAFVIDFNDEFGGEKMSCDITVESVQKQQLDEK